MPYHRRVTDFICVRKLFSAMLSELYMKPHNQPSQLSLLSMSAPGGCAIDPDGRHAADHGLQTKQPSAEICGCPPHPSMLNRKVSHTAIPKKNSCQTPQAAIIHPHQYPLPRSACQRFQVVAMINTLISCRAPSTKQCIQFQFSDLNIAAIESINRFCISCAERCDGRAGYISGYLEEGGIEMVEEVAKFAGLLLLLLPHRHRPPTNTLIQLERHHHSSPLLPNPHLPPRRSLIPLQPPRLIRQMLNLHPRRRNRLHPFLTLLATARVLGATLEARDEFAEVRDQIAGVGDGSVDVGEEEGEVVVGVGGPVE
jgi:hypothetical protein